MSDTEQTELEQLTEEARINFNRARLEYTWAKRMADPDYKGWYSNQIKAYRKKHENEPEFFTELVEEKRKDYNRAWYAYVKARMASDSDYNDKILEFRQKSTEKTKARLKELYRTDPEYRKKVLARGKAYRSTPQGRVKNRQRCAAYNQKIRLERLAMKEGIQKDEA